MRSFEETNLEPPGSLFRMGGSDSGLFSSECATVEYVQAAVKAAESRRLPDGQVRIGGPRNELLEHAAGSLAHAQRKYLDTLLPQLEANELDELALEAELLASACAVHRDGQWTAGDSGAVFHELARLCRVEITAKQLEELPDGAMGKPPLLDVQEEIRGLLFVLANQDEPSIPIVGRALLDSLETAVLKVRHIFRERGIPLDPMEHETK